MLEGMKKRWRDVVQDEEKTEKVIAPAEPEAQACACGGWYIIREQLNMDNFV